MADDENNRTFEEELRRGQAQEGGQGSVESELSVVHLMRHAAGAQVLSPEELDGVWRQISREVSPVPWYRRSWVWLGAPALAASVAVVALAVLPADAPIGAAEDGAVAAGMSMAASVQQQFAILEGPARAALAGSVDNRRGELRRSMLARAVGRGNGAGEQGGAP